MSYKNLLCLALLCISPFFTFSQSGATMLANLDLCPGAVLPSVDINEKEFRENMVTDVLRLSLKQFNEFQYDEIEVYLKSLVIKSQDYNKDSTQADFQNFEVEKSLCQLYKWYLETEGRYKSNQELMYYLERELYIKPMYQNKGDWTMRVWYFDTQNNFYNIFDLTQNSDKTLKGNYLSLTRNEEGVNLDSSELDITCLGNETEMASKIHNLNFQYERDQSRLPFFDHQEMTGNVVAIQLRKRDKKHFFFFYDLEEYAKKERHSLTHRNALKLIELIEKNYGVAMIPKLLEN